MNGLTRQPEAAPCDVIVAQFVFAAKRCQEDAIYTTVDDYGFEWRVCDDHARGGAA